MGRSRCVISPYRIAHLISNTIPEVSDNAYRDGFSTLNNTEDSFRKDGKMVSVDQRKMNAVRAYFEWMPIRYVTYTPDYLSLYNIKPSPLPNI